MTEREVELAATHAAMQRVLLRIVSLRDAAAEAFYEYRDDTRERWGKLEGEFNAFGRAVAEIRAMIREEEGR